MKYYLRFKMKDLKLELNWKNLNSSLYSNLNFRLVTKTEFKPKFKIQI